MDNLQADFPSRLKSRSSKSSPIVSKGAMAPKTLSAFLVASRSADFTNEGYFEQRLSSMGTDLDIPHRKRLAKMQKKLKMNGATAGSGGGGSKSGRKLIQYAKEKFRRKPTKSMTNEDKGINLNVDSSKKNNKSSKSKKNLFSMNLSIKHVF